MDLDLTSIDEFADLLSALAVNSASERDSSAENLLDSAGELNSHGLCSHFLSDIDNVVHLEVSVVLHVLLLLSVSGTFLEGLDDERSGGGQNCNEALSVLDHHFNLNFDSSPVSGGLLDVFTDLLGRHTEGTALGSEGSGTGDFTSNHFHVNFNEVREKGESLPNFFSWSSGLGGIYIASY